MNGRVDARGSADLPAGSGHWVASIRGQFGPGKRLGTRLMQKAAARGHAKTMSGHTVVRLLISSYFMALAVGLIPGTDLAVLARPFLPELAALFAIGLVVFSLAVMVLVGFHRRAAALLLAIVLFWASYVSMMSGNGADIGAFWRDLALIGALILTYADTEHATRNEATTVLRNLPGRIARSRPISMISSGGGEPVHDTSRAQFREDFDIVRAS